MILDFYNKIPFNIYLKQGVYLFIYFIKTGCYLKKILSLQECDSMLICKIIEAWIWKTN